MKKIYTDPVVKFFVSAIGLFIIFLVLKELQHIFIPLIIAYFLFFFFEPLNIFLEKHKVPHSVVVFIDILVTTSLIYGVGRVLFDTAISFSSQLPTFESKLNHIVSSAAKSFHIRDYSLTHFNISKIISKIDYSVLASGVFQSTLSIVINILLVLFFFIFISSGHEKTLEAIRMRFVEREVKSSIKKIKKEKKEHNILEADILAEEEYYQQLKNQREETLQKTFSSITEQVQKYIITKLLISLSVGLIMGIVLYLFNVEYYVIWAAIAVILNFIPNIGSVIAVILPTLMALVQHESFGYAIMVAIVLIVLQNIIGNIIEPKVFGDRLGLNPLVILLSLLLWGYLWGIVGMFISVPLTAVIKIIISNSKSSNMQFISRLMSN